MLSSWSAPSCPPLSQAPHPLSGGGFLLSAAVLIAFPTTDLSRCGNCQVFCLSHYSSFLAWTAFWPRLYPQLAGWAETPPAQRLHRPRSSRASRSSQRPRRSEHAHWEGAGSAVSSLQHAAPGGGGPWQLALPSLAPLRLRAADNGCRASQGLRQGGPPLTLLLSALRFPAWWPQDVPVAWRSAVDGTHGALSRSSCAVAMAFVCAGLSEVLASTPRVVPLLSW
uniref:sperm equatorial segment protein 1 isoform X2 n=1 Tax=Callithrix jacchus TaxID=9483 RepID=UPI0023DCED91|nr:sperm equatorial segment protein 1 isoform X2 [Callithrix jacchus]